MGRLTGSLVVSLLLIAAAVVAVAALRPPAGLSPGAHPASPYHGPTGSGNADPYGAGPHLRRPPTGPLTGDL
jgi:hypothetical protein